MLLLKPSKLFSALLQQVPVLNFDFQPKKFLFLPGLNLKFCSRTKYLSGRNHFFVPKNPQKILQGVKNFGRCSIILFDIRLFRSQVRFFQSSKIHYYSINAHSGVEQPIYPLSR